ncbi:ABC transporter ATP-binding protein [Mangrovibrevibacter kandeliae]|uniref:ABC transporter ATP-binding protein n=1 Tax=Mangrovibrevibacter kandeliae TaxID=2968473 RepID=UPI002118C1B5|nr:MULTISPECIES: ABC transporter ATP-binding protein [unclassified Aurantimonas]MCQ8781056.1 ABC transporter ATP-binding protein [Aurantimonas sp. CSK15Z-1]MCW4113838.1 ABC transporter ATP-binding protein [Aurantimonas sp. MSK8Z-1]
MSFLRIEGVKKSFGGNTVVRGFDLSVEKGEFISFLGPSGCGKTTMLRMVAGFETPTAGTISIDGQDVTAQPPNRRRIGMVFQAYALFPNMSVADNVAFGLKIAGMPAAQIRERVAEMLTLIGLRHLADRYPYQLSGGQQQRVALARALAPSPRVLLLDEPLSALDAKIRVSLREEIRALQRKLGITTIFVTHDQEEALSMSDRIVVMNEGRADQIGTPFEIYNRPKTRFVASFVGNLSLLEGEGTGDARAILAGDEVILPFPARGRVILGLRPEAASLQASADRTNQLTGRIDEVNFLGSLVRLRVAVAGAGVLVDMFNNPGNPPPGRGDIVTIHFAPADVQVLEHTPPELAIAAE